MNKLLNAARTALLVPSLALAWVNLGFAQTTQDQAAKEAVRSMANAVCATCHGNEGRSTNPAIPNLAGQQRAYIEIQLKAFRVQSRRDPEAHEYMWGIAATWLYDDKVVADIADYYSSQPPVHGKPADPAAAAIAKQLYEKGWLRETDRVVVFNTGTGLKYR